MENWKALDEFQGNYEVSDLGRIRRVVYLNGVLSHKDGNGYLRVALKRVGSKNNALVPIHRLVLSAFVEPIKDARVGNHKNGIKTDNRLENLEIITHRQDRLHAFRELGQQKMQGSKHGRSKLTEEQVLEIRRLGEKREWGIGSKLAKQFGVGPQIISFILNRKNWKHI